MSKSEFPRILFRQLSTFPGSLPPSIIDAKDLNFCVRHGYRCFLFAIITGFFSLFDCTFKTKQYSNDSLLRYSFFSWLSPRPISTDQLNTLLHLHLRPINHIVSMGSYCFRMGNLILEGASRLDAFSVYPVRTSLPCYALGRTTDAQLVRPTRSSRTKVSSPQISYARDR